MKKKVDTALTSAENGLVDAEVAISKLDAVSVFDFTNIFKSFQSNSTDKENIEGTVCVSETVNCLKAQFIFNLQANLLSIALNADFPKVNRTIFDFWFNRNSDEIDSDSSEENYSPFVLLDLRDSSLKKLEGMFSNVLTPSQTEEAMRILRGLGEDATTQQEEATKVSGFPFLKLY